MDSLTRPQLHESPQLLKGCAGAISCGDDIAPTPCDAGALGYRVVLIDHRPPRTARTKKFKALPPSAKPPLLTSTSHALVALRAKVVADQ